MASLLHEHDAAFLDSVVDAWGVETKFKHLVETITPVCADPDVVKAIEDVIKEAADAVWDLERSVELELIGSCRTGTDILKRDGQSDRDYSLNVSEMTEEEWKTFCHTHLRRHYPDLSVGEKAVRFYDARLHQSCEITPVHGNYSHDKVTFPTLEGADDTSIRNQNRWKFYEDYPGAKGTVKVLKRLLPDMKGNTIEALVGCKGKQILQNDANYATQDRFGEKLFKQIVLLFQNSKVSCGDSNSPLKLLKEDARKFNNVAVPNQIEEAIEIAEHIYSEVSQHAEECGPLRRGLRFALYRFLSKDPVALVCAVFGAICFALCFYQFVQKSAASIPRQSLRRGECPDESCFCSDCRDTWYSCKRTPDLDCKLPGISWTLNRCSITRCLTMFFIVMFSYTGGSAVVALVDGGRKHQFQHHPLLRICFGCVVGSSAIALLYYVRFLGLGNPYIMCSKALNLQNALSSIMSAAVCALVLRRSPVNRFDRELLSSAVLMIFLAGLCYNDINFCLQETDPLTFRQQDHMFYSITLILQLLLALISWRCAGPEMQIAVRNLFFAQLFWEACDVWYLLYLQRSPSEQTKYNLLNNIFCLMALVWKLQTIVGLHGAKQSHPQSSQSRLRRLAAKTIKMLTPWVRHFKML